jgi:hypothetical protein
MQAVTTMGASRVSSEIAYGTSPSAFIRPCKNTESLCNPCMEMAISVLHPTLLQKYVITMERTTNLKRRMVRKGSSRGSTGVAPLGPSSSAVSGGGSKKHDQAPNKQRNQRAPTEQKPGHGPLFRTFGGHNKDDTNELWS